MGLLVLFLVALSASATAQPWVTYSTPSSFPTGSEDVVVRAVGNGGSLLGGSLAGNSVLTSTFLGAGAQSLFLSLPSGLGQLDAWCAGAVNSSGVPQWVGGISTDGIDFVSDVASTAATNTSFCVGAMNASSSSSFIASTTVFANPVPWTLPSGFLQTGPSGFILAVNANATLRWARSLGNSYPQPTVSPVVPALPWSFTESAPGATGMAAPMSPYGRDGAFGVATDGSGNVYVAAQLSMQSGRLVGYSITLPGYDVSNLISSSGTGFDAYLLSFSPAGILRWWLRGGNTLSFTPAAQVLQYNSMLGSGPAEGQEGSFAVAVHPTNADLVVFGGATGSADFGFATSSAPLVELVSFQGVSDGASVGGWAVQVDSSGSLGWYVSVAGSAQAAVFGVACAADVTTTVGLTNTVVAQGGVYLAGAFSGLSLTVSSSLNAQVTITQAVSGAAFSLSGFLAKLDATGYPLWAVLAGSAEQVGDGSSAGAVVYRVSVGGNAMPVVFGTSTLASAFFGHAQTGVELGTGSTSFGWLQLIQNNASSGLTASSGFAAGFDSVSGNLTWAVVANSAAGNANTSVSVLSGAGAGVGTTGAYLGGAALIHGLPGTQPTALVGTTALGSCAANAGGFTSGQTTGRSGFASFVNISLCASNSTSGNPYTSSPSVGQNTSGTTCTWPGGCGFTSTMVAAVATNSVLSSFPLVIYNSSNFTCSALYTCSTLSQLQMSSLPIITVGSQALYLCQPIANACPSSNQSIGAIFSAASAYPGLYVAFMQSNQCTNGVPTSTPVWPLPNITAPTVDLNYTFYSSTGTVCSTGRAWPVSQQWATVLVGNSSGGDNNSSGNSSNINNSSGNSSNYNNSTGGNYNSSNSNNYNSSSCTGTESPGCGINATMYKTVNATNLGLGIVNSSVTIMPVSRASLACLALLACTPAPALQQALSPPSGATPMQCQPGPCASGQTLLTTGSGVFVVWVNDTTTQGCGQGTNFSSNSTNTKTGTYAWPTSTGVAEPSGWADFTLWSMANLTQCVSDRSWLWNAGSSGNPSVSTTVTLGGYTTSTFNASVASQYDAGVAAVLNLPGAQFVSIASVQDVTVRRRHLTAVGVAVGTRITGAVGTSAASLLTTIANLGSNATLLRTALLAAGLSSVSVQAIAPAAALSGCALQPCPSRMLCLDGSFNAAMNTSYTCSCPAGQAGSSVSPCVSCGAIPQPQLLPSFTTPLRRSTSATFYASVATPSGAADGTPCNFSAAYYWTVTDGQGNVQSSLGGASGSAAALTLPAAALAAGPSAQVQLKVCYAGDTAFALGCSPVVSFAFSVAASPLVAALAGGGARISAGSAAVLDGSGSRDPDAAVGGGLTYAWTCSGPPSNRGCLDATGTAVAPSSSSQLALSRLVGAPDPGATYAFNLTVSTPDGRSATISTAVIVVTTAAALPVVSIAPLATLSLNPSVRNTLVGTVTPGVSGDALALAWSISPNSQGTSTALGNGILADPCVLGSVPCTVSTTAVTSSSFVLLPGALTGSGLIYTFRLTATEAGGGVAFAEVSVPVLAIYPVPGSLAVSPTTGTALITPFVVSAPGWTVPGNASIDLPLQYSFAYISDAGATPQLLTAFRPQSSASVTLPAGSLSLIVFVQTARGATTNTSLALAYAQQVTVLPASAQQTAVAITSAVALAQAGSTDASLQLAGGIASGFNAAPSTDQSRLDARQQLITGAINTTIASLASTTTTASSLQALSGVLASLTAAPSELSAASQTTAVAALTSIASSSLVNVPTAASVVFSLSNVSVSAISGNANYTALPTGAGVANTTTSNSSTAAISVLRPVLAAMTTLATTLQAQLTVPGEVPVEVIAPAIQAQVALDVGTPSPGRYTRLFNSTIGSSGSPARFGSLASDALAGSNLTAVNTSFHYMTFDPHSGSTNGTGNIRLLLSGPNGSAVPVRNLSQPITIVQPALNASQLASGSGAAVCTFWNTAQQVYSSDGCLGLPNPVPPGINVSFSPVPAGSGSSLLTLMTALSFGPVQSPLLAGCRRTMLDCTSASAGSLTAYLNPSNPLASIPQWGPTRVQCPQAGSTPVGLGGTLSSSARVLLVYWGSTCQLWQANNTARCFWNATGQSFQGPGCVPSTAPSQCLCSHLTDFSVLTFPNIPVATPTQLLAVSPKDIVTKLRFLFFLIFGLFIGMHIGCLAGLGVDIRRKRVVLATLTSPDLGFTALPNGVWTWAVLQDPLTDALGPVTGSAVRLARLVGMPYVRLRCAIPEELLPGELAHVVGRSEGLSMAANAQLSGDIHSLVAAALGSGTGTACLCGPKGGTSVSAEEGRAGEAAPLSKSASLVAIPDKALARMTSTALVFAFMWVRLLVPREQLIVRQAAASRHFAGVVSGGNSFDTLVARFMDLLAAGLHTKARWLEKARVWRLLFLQHSDGFWDISPGLAFALHCTIDRTGVAKGAPVSWQRVARAVGGLAGGDDEAALEDDPGGVPITPASPQTPDTATFTGATGAFVAASGVAVSDDPLSFDISAVERSMPHSLRALPYPDLAARIWATSLAAALLAATDFSWVENGGETRDSYGAGELTLLDGALQWLDATVAEYEAHRQEQLDILHAPAAPASATASVRLPPAPPTPDEITQEGDPAADAEPAANAEPAADAVPAPRLRTGLTVRMSSYPLKSPGFDEDIMPPLAPAMAQVKAKAARLVKEWDLMQEERVSALRSVSQKGALYTTTQLARLTGDTARALTTKHELASIFLGPPQEGLHRWQKMLVVVTTILGALCVETWFYQVKASNCCAQIRTFLGCDPSNNTPCRGFTGDCADIKAQFGDVPLDDGGTVADFECHAFPDEASLIDSFYVGLIFALCALPLRFIVGELLAKSNEAERCESFVARPRLIRMAFDFFSFLGLAGIVVGSASAALVALLFVIAIVMLNKKFAGHHSWHYSAADETPSRFMRLAARFPEFKPLNVLTEGLADGLTVLVLRIETALSCACFCGTGRLAALAALDEELHAPEVRGNYGAAEETHAKEEPAQGAPETPRSSRVVGLQEELHVPEQASQQAPPKRHSSRLSTHLAQSSRKSLASDGGDVGVQARVSTRLTSTEAAAPHHGGAHPHEAEGEEAAEEEERLVWAEEQLALAIRARIERVLGLFGTYAAWALLSWFIFTYGLLIYELLGIATEASFVKSWLIALGVENARQWQDILRAALQAAVLMFVLDRMWIMSNAAWVEQHVDYLSVQATLLTGRVVTWSKRVRRHVDFYAGVD